MNTKVVLYINVVRVIWSTKAMCWQTVEFIVTAGFERIDPNLTKQWTHASVTFQFPVSDSFLVKNCRCLFYSPYGQLGSVCWYRWGREHSTVWCTNELAVHNRIYKWQVHSQALKICLFQVILRIPVVLTHTHTCKVVSILLTLALSCAGSHTKQNFPVQRKKYL